MTRRLLNVGLVLLVACVVAQADTFIDFEAPTYTVDTVINGQDNWVEPNSVTMVRDNAALGSQIIDFSDGAGSLYLYATRDLNDTYSSGKVRITALHRNISGQSGYLRVEDPCGRPIVRLGMKSDNTFYCAEGVDDTWVGESPGGSARWLAIQIDIDLDNNTANMGWRELDGTFKRLFTDYELYPATVARITLGNHKSAAMFDNISVTVPGPTVIDFEAPTYTADTLINGQDGWLNPSNVAKIIYDPNQGSQIIDFSDAGEARRLATRELNDTYDSGKVRLTILQKNLSGRSGYLTLNDSSGDEDDHILMFGIRNTSEFYCAGGVAGLQLLDPPGGAVRWIGIQIEIDLDNYTADMSWHELGGELNLLLSGYQLYPKEISRITLHNKEVPAQFDDIHVDSFVTTPQTCQEVWDKGYGLPADLNKDCYVDLMDVAALAGKWMDCVDPENLACGQ